jgi:hypothetical protein
MISEKVKNHIIKNVIVREIIKIEFEGMAYFLTAFPFLFHQQLKEKGVHLE